MTKSNIRIQSALKAQIGISKLTAKEQEIFFEEFFVLMQRKATPEQEASFKNYIATH